MLFKRVKEQIKKRGRIDLCRKSLFYLVQKKEWFLSPFKKTRAWLYFKSTGVRLGKRVILKGLSYNINVGNDLNIYDTCIIEMVGEQAKLWIGNRCLFSYGVLISCQQSIIIGNDVMIGEYTSVRDTSHSYKDITRPMKQGKDVSNPVVIGNDVWIGRGCLIMGGAIIEDGVVIAAHSVVKGRLEKNSIYGGSPVRFLKSRT